MDAFVLFCFAQWKSFSSQDIGTHVTRTISGYLKILASISVNGELELLWQSLWLPENRLELSS